MDASLYDVLSGSFADGRSLTSVREDQRRLWSVVSNLNRLFNTRRGSVEHLPDYGLPDMLTVYRDAARSIDDLRRSIKQLVEAYEPRLRRVRVKHRETEEYEMRLVFLLEAELIDGSSVRFETTFSSHDSAKVTPTGRVA
jgi:type VI secretion system protein